MEIPGVNGERLCCGLEEDGIEESPATVLDGGCQKNHHHLSHYL